MLDQTGAVTQVKEVLWPALKAERDRVERIDKWYRQGHEKPHMPQQSSKEYQDIAKKSEAPWGRRVVTAATDQLYVEGYRSKGAGENAGPWRWWQANGLDGRQIALHDAALAYGLAYSVVTPGESALLGPMPVIRYLDASQMVTASVDPAWDEFPAFALRAEPAEVGRDKGWALSLYDDEAVHRLQCSADGDKLTYITHDVHGVGVCPVVRFSPSTDLRSRSEGDIEPVIPLLAKIDQTSFDRLVVQRFGAWVVRYITGMAPPDKLEGESEDQYRRRVKLVLQVSDILLAEDPNSKVGSLPATPLDGYIAAHDADARILAAVTQTPVHELIGQMANMSAEALAAAEASLSRRVNRSKHLLGEAHETTLRLAALVAGERDAAADVESQVRWADLESRSLAQAADALGKMATLLGIPVEMLWERLPDWTDTDTERAKTLRSEGDAMDVLTRALTGNLDEPEA